MIRSTLFAAAVLSSSVFAAPLKERAPFQMGYLYDFETSLDDGGEVSSHFFHISGGVPIVNEDDIFIALTGAYHVNDYSFSGGDDGSIAALAPWDSIHTVRLGGVISWDHDDKWKFFINPSARFIGESGANVSDSVKGGALVGLSYKFSDSLTIGPGVGYIGQIEDDASIFPILVIDWQITESLSITTGPTVGATLGPGLALRWKVRDDLRFTFGARHERLRFRLDESNDSSPDGIGEEKSIPVYGAFTWQATEHLQSSLIFGVGLGRSLELEDSSGERLIKEDSDPAPFIGINLGYNF